MSQVKSTNNLNAVNLVVTLSTEQSVKFAEKVRPMTGIGNYTSDRRPQLVPNLVMTGTRTFANPPTSQSPARQTGIPLSKEIYQEKSKYFAKTEVSPK